MYKVPCSILSLAKNEIGLQATQPLPFQGSPNSHLIKVYYIKTVLIMVNNIRMEKYSLFSVLSLFSRGKTDAAKSIKKLLSLVPISLSMGVRMAACGPSVFGVLYPIVSGAPVLLGRPTNSTLKGAHGPQLCSGSAFLLLSSNC